MHLLQCNSNTFNSNACICFEETTIISIQLHQFRSNCARFNPFNHFEPTVIILVWLQLRFSHLALFLNLAVVISSYLHAFQAKLLRRANCNYFRLSAPVFGAKYNIFQLSAPVGEKTWIISIWLQFKCTYFEPTATISILLHLFRANVTRIETIWFFMFRANFNNFNLTAPFLSGVSYFFCYALPIFRANFTKQWTLSNQLQFFPASCMCVCVCVWDIWECFKMTAPVPSHTQLFRSKAALLSIQLQLWGLVGCGTFDKSQFFAFANYLAQTRKTKQIASQKFWLALGV